MDDDQNWIFWEEFNFYQVNREQKFAGGGMDDIMIFNEIISSVSLVELPLNGRAYTWSNIQDQPPIQQFD